jgi:segregation and condensation protein A
MAEPAVRPADAADPWGCGAADGRPAVPRQRDAVPMLSVAGFEGPLDFLLDRVHRRRVDLGRLSIVSLTDQFVATLDRAQGVTLARRGDWLVMAATLLLLKAQRLWPATPDTAAQAERRLGQLDALAQAWAAAAWLAAQTELGVDVFARGRSALTPHPQAELYVAFLEATLVMLGGVEEQGEEESPLYQAVIPDLWRAADALALFASCSRHIRRAAHWPGFSHRSRQRGQIDR